MRWIIAVLFSNKLTLLALLAYAFSMAYATFFENDFGTSAARGVIYDAWWFEILMLIISINFIGNIFKYRLYRKEKLSLFMFHVAFLVILMGAFVTRYTGQEGLIRIREGSNSNKIITEERFLLATVERGGEAWSVEEELQLTRFDSPSGEFVLGTTPDPIEISILDFVPDAVQVLADGDETSEVIEVVSAGGGQGRVSHFLAQEASIFINGHELTFNQVKPGAINIEKRGQLYTINSPEAFTYIVMANQQAGYLKENVQDTLRIRSLYQSDHLQFVVSYIHAGKKVEFQTTDDKEVAKDAADLLFVELRQGQMTKNMILASVDGVFSPPQLALHGDYKVNISYGPKSLDLPFSLGLVDFQLERYPGSTSPSSYASELMVQDQGASFPVKISMNNVLDHGGYRFFQASYDLDEKGTVLSVNRDFWGTQITYLGYFLMSLGMIMTLFGRNSRFQQINQKLNKLKGAAVVLYLLAPGTSSAQAIDQVNGLETEVDLTVDAAHAMEFGQLMVQDMDGRIKPINTLASEFVRKLTRKTTLDLEVGRMNSDQIFLSMHQNPVAWQHIPLIKVDPKKGGPILEQLEFEGRAFLSFQDLIKDNGDYRLSMAVEAAQRKKPAERNELDNEIIKVDERFNILFQGLSGNYLKIFPQKSDPTDKWYNQAFVGAGFSQEDSLFVRNILPAYYQNILEARETGDWTDASDQLAYIRTFQRVMGVKVLPTDGRVEAELLYNELGLFNKLFPVYWILGIALLCLAITRVFTDSIRWKRIYQVCILLTAIAFLTQTFNMILRWYAGDYPPWSNGYEMIILVSWALFLFGFIFYRKSDFIMPVVALFGGTLLFVSYLDWLNPEITNLVPVLKSYWLKIHVAIIVSSYAPLALSALLGLISLVFMITRNDRFEKSITELTYINELSMTIGLFMLAIGTFLGGVWANESWGRYWGWDPKETWALISVIIYAVVLHLRLIPSLRGPYTFSLASVVAFFSIVMTSFGVNYYLSGLHSYAAGDPLPIPNFVYWVVGIVLVIALIAYWRRSTFNVEPS